MVNRAAPLRSRSLIGLSLFLVIGLVTGAKQARGQSKAVQRDVVQRPLGLVDDIALAKARSDFPVLAPRVLPQIAAQKKLAGIVFKSGIAWSGNGLHWMDVTADVLAKLRSFPVQAAKMPLMSAAQKQASEKAILALTQLKAATSIGVSFEDFSARLINAQATVETSLAVLPDGALHAAIDQTMQTYNSSLGTWRDIQSLKPLQDRIVQVKRDLEDDAPMNSIDKLKLEFARQHEDEAREQKSLEPLYAKWNEARAQLAEAVRLSATKN